MRIIYTDIDEHGLLDGEPSLLFSHLDSEREKLDSQAPKKLVKMIDVILVNRTHA